MNPPRFPHRAQTHHTLFAIITAVSALTASFASPALPAFAETLGTCKVCRDYDRACRDAHSKQVCKAELEMCLKHCAKKK